MCIGNHTYKIGLIYKKIRAAKLKKWCVYVCGKKGRGGGGGGGGRGKTTYRVGNLIYIILFRFGFTCFEIFFF